MATSRDADNAVRVHVQSPEGGARAGDHRAPGDDALPPARRSRSLDEVHPLLAQQLQQAADAGGELRLSELIRLVSEQYAAFDADRDSLEHVMRIASDEATALSAQLEMDSIHRLQAILDHVKDGIISCDRLGRIESMNRTAERFFGVSQGDLLSLTLDELMPALAPQGDIARVLEDLAAARENTHFDLSARDVQARHRCGELMPAEILVSKVPLPKRPVYIICVRDTLERSKVEVALKDSEARYRVLVENAPEVVVVFDAETNRFVDCNENACHFFKMTRVELLQRGPPEVSPPEQADGTPSFGIARGHIQAAMAGGAPVFEWQHVDAEGKLIPCEVRLVRLPSSARPLIRGSIIDITDRKRSEQIAAGERRVFEKIAASAGFNSALEAITQVIEQVLPGAVCCISLYDADRNVLVHAAGQNLPREFMMLMDDLPVEIRYGSCAAAVALQRQIIVPDVRHDPFWEYRSEAAVRYGLQACWSTPIRSADGRMLGAFATYMKRTGMPGRRDLELMGRMTQLARIAIERHRAEQALRDSERRYRGLFDNVVEGVYQVTVAGELISANPALVEMLGFDSLEDLRTAGVTADLYVDPSAREALLARLVSEGELVEAEYELRRRDDSVITVSENARVIRDERGRVTGFEGTLTDITERKRAELRLHEEKERAQVTLQSIVDAVVTVDRTGRIDYMNPVAESLTEWTAEEALGQPLGEVVRFATEEGHEPVEDPVRRATSSGRPAAVPDQTVLLSRRGQEVAIQANAAPIRDREGRVGGAVMVFHDVSRERRMKRLLSYQAAHDALTGLLNRREFENRLGAALASLRENPGQSHALLYLDLDQFKLVNDTCGHAAGDQLLRQVTGLLQTRVRASDVIARLGGDEFGILFEQCSNETALRLADGLRQAIRDYRFVWEGQAMQIGASIGIVEMTPETESIAALFSAADLACYAAKDGGRNRVHLYDPASASARDRQTHWVTRLTSAKDQGRLELAFQPIMPVAAGPGRRPHYELLLRLTDEDGREIMPGEFIPVAERYNVMPVLDRWVVERTLAELVPSRRDGVHVAPYTLALNLSGASLSDQCFIESLLEQLEEHDPTPGVLCFEITETAAITNLANASHIMRELASRGCLLTLDDFGSGLSSFHYLRNLPVHYLKIDGQFVQDVAHDPIDRSLVEAIVQVGRAMGMETIAERVESQEVLDALEGVGVGYAQGWLLGRPVPIRYFPQR
jgi:diguanylate cyclase (GGDEF)-like protein/PAS domain S-box-containing protein